MNTLAIANTVAHHPGVVNSGWPLCWEDEARTRGWTPAEILDGELPEGNALYVTTAEAFRIHRDSQCQRCAALVYA